MSDSQEKLEMNTLFAEAQIAFKNNEYEKFQELMDKFIPLKKKYEGKVIATMHYAIAQSYVIVFNYGDTISEIKKAIAESPNDLSYRQELKRLQAKLKEK